MKVTSNCHGVCLILWKLCLRNNFLFLKLTFLRKIFRLKSFPNYNYELFKKIDKIRQPVTLASMNKPLFIFFQQKKKALFQSNAVRSRWIKNEGKKLS